MHVELKVVLQVLCVTPAGMLATTVAMRAPTVAMRAPTMAMPGPMRTGRLGARMHACGGLAYRACIHAHRLQNVLLMSVVVVIVVVVVVMELVVVVVMVVVVVVVVVVLVVLLRACALPATAAKQALQEATSHWTVF